MVLTVVPPTAAGNSDPGSGGPTQKGLLPGVPAVSEAVAPNLAVGPAAFGSSASASWPLLLTVTANVSAVCAFRGDRCAGAPATVRIRLDARVPTTSGSTSTSTQVLFLLDASTLTACGNSGDCLPGGTASVNAFLQSAGTITHSIAQAHPGVNLSFALATTGSAGGVYDDGDGLPYVVPVGNFTNASLFGLAASRAVSYLGDIDSGDNALQSSIITALYGAFSGLPANDSLIGGDLSGPVNWTSSERHVVVWIGATAPVDANYPEYACPLTWFCWYGAANSTMPTCSPSTGLSQAMPTCEGWTSSQNGNPLDSIVALARSGSACLNASLGHCTVDSVIVNATSTDPSSGGWVPSNTSGSNRTDVRIDTQHVVQAGCDIARLTGGSWDGPLHSACGNYSGTLGYAGGLTNTELVNALANLSLGSPGGPPVASPVAGVSMFRFVTTPAFVPAPSLGAIVDCTSATGTISGCPQSPSVESQNGSTALSWNWTTQPGHVGLRPGDAWSASFNLVAVGAPANATPVDRCATSSYAAVGNASGTAPFSSVEFHPWGLPTAWNESFPLLTLSVDGAAPLGGTMFAAVTTADAPSTLPFNVFTAGGYPPFEVSWHFGDGTFTNSTSLYTNHTYTSAGSFRLGVQVRDAGGGTLNLSRVITVLPPLLPNVTSGPIDGVAPLGISFTSSPEGGRTPYRVDWDFGDGTAATGPTPSHTFDVPGRYVVLVTVTDSLGRAVNTTVPVLAEPARVPPLVASASAMYLAVPACTPSPQPTQIQFAGEATGGAPPYAYAWFFGDGKSGSGPNVTHAYATTPEHLDARLKVTDSLGNVALANVTSVTGGVFAGPPCATRASGLSIPTTTIEVGVLAVVAAAAIVIGVRWRRK
jgi:PKD repeat protein